MNEMPEISSLQQSGKAKDQQLGESGDSPVSVVRPLNSFTGSSNGRVEQSIPERFKEMVRTVACKMDLVVEPERVGRLGIAVGRRSEKLFSAGKQLK